MGRLLNISQPEVIITNLTPLSDNFWVSASDTLEQWFYVNDGSYKPNRTLTPLVLTPMIEAVDTDSGIKYTPSFQTVNWYVVENGTSTLVTATDATQEGRSQDFYQKVATKELVVRKNAPATSATSNGGINIKVEVTVIDPRDLSNYIIYSSVLLTCNKDATILSIDLEPLFVQNQTFNVITERNNSVKTYSVKALKGDQEIEYTWIEEPPPSGTTPTVVTSLPTASAALVNQYYQVGTVTFKCIQLYFYWSATNIKAHGQDTQIQNFPAYIETAQPAGKGQGTNTICLDAMYMENFTISCQIRKGSSSAAFYPGIVTSTLTWQTPKARTVVTSDSGSGVTDINRQVNFRTLINLKNRTIAVGQVWVEKTAPSGITPTVVASLPQATPLLLGQYYTVSSTSTTYQCVSNPDLDNFLINYKETLSTNAIVPTWTDADHPSGMRTRSLGWGYQIHAKSDDLNFNKITGSTNSGTVLVSTDFYLKGAYENVTYTNGGVVENVTYNNAPVYERN